MTLPPLQPTPNLSRLLGPDETAIYTCKLHPVHGLRWLLGALLLTGLAWWLSPWFLVAAIPCLAIYWLPFHNHEVLVSSKRLLVRHGRFSVHVDAIDREHLDHYQLHQTTIGSLLHFGTVILNLRANRDIRTVTLKTLWHPMSFLEALTTLNPNLWSK